MTDGIYLQGHGKTFGARYCDLIKPHKVDRRTGDEIAADVIRKAGITLV